MRSAWVQSQDRKRLLQALGATMGLYLCLALGVTLYDIIAPDRLASMSGPVLIDLGGKAEEAPSVPLGAPLAPERPMDAPATSAAAAAGSGAPATAATSTAASSVAAVTAKPAPAATTPAKAAAAAATKPASNATAAARAAPEIPAAALPSAPNPLASGAGSKSFSSAGSVPAAPGTPGASPGTGVPGSVVYRGMEMGNVQDTRLVGPQGKVGRNLYVDIWLYLPLPTTVPDAVYRAIPDDGSYYKAKDRQLGFAMFYTKSGDVWKLNAPVPLDSRGQLWLMLQDAGYNPATADYRNGGALSPVRIEFAIEPGTHPKLIYINMTSSSGSKAIDEAVLYAFEKASYFNDSGNAVSGTFVYDFNGGKP